MDAFVVVLVQIIVILSVARAAGWLFGKLGQPQVIGEMVAGILLGPSLLGWLAPGVSAALFPPASLQALNLLSQLGLVLFMFLVGLELDARRLRGRSHTTVLISHASILLPFALGMLVAWYIYPRLSDGSIPVLHFALFLGTAMSITAFPVLARILAERGLLHTQLGTIAISCAAVDDITAWCILAGVVALVHSGAHGLPFWATISGSLVYLALMLFPVRRALRRLLVPHSPRRVLTLSMLTLVLSVVLVSAWITESLGIHALFGAFLAGVVMPKERGWLKAVTGKLMEDVVLLLPLFFAYSGLHTSIGLVITPEYLVYFGLIMMAAIGGKFGGCALTAGATGLPWREAGALGILMNTRGLIELVVLNVGLNLGIISQTVFTMLVLMALLTTFMTMPLLQWFYLSRQPKVAIVMEDTPA